MPGPCNLKKKKQTQANKEKRKLKQRKSISCTSSSSPSLATPDSATDPQVSVAGKNPESWSFDSDCLVPKSPYIHDPGNGPRVRDTRAFLTSYFAQPPSLHDPLCAEFAQEEVLQMLCTVLPEETALILWYNKSRATGRICPACQRLYRLGDVLPDHMINERDRPESLPPPQLGREQEISGLCSPVCFILASFNYPGAIKSTWGRMGNDMSDNTWALLNSPGEGHRDMGLGMLLKMTRLDDLGLGQLCLPDIDFEEGEPQNDVAVVSPAHEHSMLWKS